MFEDCIFPAYVGAGGAPTFIHTAAAAAIDREQIFRRCLFLNAIGAGATAMTAGVTMAASSGGVVIWDNCGNYGLTAICDATTKSQMYLNGPAVNGAAGVMVTVT